MTAPTPKNTAAPAARLDAVTRRFLGQCWGLFTVLSLLGSGVAYEIYLLFHL